MPTKRPKARRPVSPIPKGVTPSGSQGILLHGQRLAPRQAAFVTAYLVSLNATQAYRDAGYACPTSQVAEVGGSKLVRHAKVAKAIEQGMAKTLKKAGTTADQVIQDLLEITRTDLRKLVDAQGKLLPLKDWPDELAAVIGSVEVGKGGTVHKVKALDKLGALTLLGRYHKLFTDKLEVSGDLVLSAARLRQMSDAELLEAAQKNAEQSLAVVKRAQGPR